MKAFFPSISALLAVAGVSLGISGCARVLNLPDPVILKTQYPVIHYLPKAPKGTQDFTVALQRARPPGWVDLPSVSKAAIGAIVVSEDWAFYQHKGYDPNQIREALKEKVEDGGVLRGASTITQQVARNVFLTQDRNAVRKVRELVLAIRMEQVLGKRRILETYLNIAELGEGIYGIGAASQYYFNKPPSQLKAKEGAFLAMLLPSPKRYAVSFRLKHLTEYAQDTVASILDKMVQAHYLTAEQKWVELARPLSFEPQAGGDAVPAPGASPGPSAVPPLPGAGEEDVPPDTSS
jgi:monofunctional glycosyltransferase